MEYSPLWTTISNIIIFFKLKRMFTTTFRCPSAIGIFVWVVMLFGLKNDVATYQRATSMIFHDLIGRIVEVYIDGVVVESNEFE